MHSTKLLLRFAGVTLLLLLCACGSRINSANFAKIQSDMSVEQVTTILGEASESNSMEVGPFSGTQSIWKSDATVITVQFVNNKVKAKQLSAGTK